MRIRRANRPVSHATEDMAELAPMMDAGQAAAAWRTYRAARDAGDRDAAIAARNRIVEANLRLIPYTMNKYPGLARMHASDADAFQDGAIALVAAVESFDPALGFTFANWAVHRIRWRMQLGPLGWRPLGRKAQSLIHNAARLFYAERGYQPNEAELLELTGLSNDQLQLGLAWRRLGGAQSLDAPTGDKAESNLIAEGLADKSAVDPCTFIRQGEAEAFLLRILAGLKPLYRKLLWLRFYAGWTVAALAEHCHMARQWIWDILTRAVEKLRRRYATAYRIWAGLDGPTRGQAEAELGGQCNG